MNRWQSFPIEPELTLGTPVGPRLRGGAPLTGLLLKMPCAAQVEAAGETGFDLVVLDTEHGPGGTLELEQHVRAADAAGVAALVRVPNHDPVWIQAALDSGAAGVIVPRVLSGDAVRSLVNAAHYPPRGRRGLALTTRAGHHGAANLADHLARAAEQTTVAIQIEDAEALPLLDQILSIEGVDAVLIGANDLSMSLGHPGATGHPEVAAAIDSIFATAARHRKAVMLIASTLAEAETARTRGAATILFVASQLMLAALRSVHGRQPGTSIGPEPLLLVPGTACDHDLWTGVTVALTPGFEPRVVRIDLDDSISEMAATVLASAPDRFALAGHSQGAVVCLEIMRRAPERVTRLALLNASARPGDDAQLVAWASLRARLEADDSRLAVVREFVRTNLGRSDRQPMAARMTAMAERIGRHGILRQLAAQAGRPDARPGLPAIRCPTLVISGDGDQVCPPDLQVELAGAIPRARLEVLANCGHMSPLEQPEQVAALLREWLADG